MAAMNFLAAAAPVPKSEKRTSQKSTKASIHERV